KNKFSLPLGFTYDKYMLQSDFKNVGKDFNDIALLSVFTIPDSMKNSFRDLKRVNEIDTTKNFTWDTYAEAIDSLRKDTMTMTTFSQTNIAGKIFSAQKEMLFLSI